MLEARSCAKFDHVLLDRVDIGLHRFGHVQHEHDIDRTALPDAAKIENLGLLAVLEDLHIVGAQIADRLAVLIGQAEIELDAAVGIEMLQARIADHHVHRGKRIRSRAQLETERRGHDQRHRDHR